MTCKTCGRSISPFAPARDCGRHYVRPTNVIVQSPFVRRALERSLPASDQTGRIIIVKH